MRASACIAATDSRRSAPCSRRRKSAASARWPQGVMMAWYPIKHGAVAARLHRRLRDAGVNKLLVADLCIFPDDSRAGLNGSGLVTINPPGQFDDDLRKLVPVLHRALSDGGTGRTRVAMLAGD